MSPARTQTRTISQETTNPTESSRLVRDYNALITCPLCRGYFIEATTVTECLHAFCRSCILQYVEHNAACPVCQVPLQSSRPHIHLKRDHTLQTIVYKLVPDLSKKELQRRLDFYASQANSAGVAQAAKELHLEGFFSPTDSISFSLEFVPPSPEKEAWKPVVASQETNEPHYGIRYFKCPAAVTIHLLEQLLRRKYQVGDNYHVDFFYGRAKLASEYRLSDVAYIFAWKQREPMRLRYNFNLAPDAKKEIATPVPSPVVLTLPPPTVAPLPVPSPAFGTLSVPKSPVFNRRNFHKRDSGVKLNKEVVPPKKQVWLPLAEEDSGQDSGRDAPVSSNESLNESRRKRRKRSLKKQIGVRRKSHGKHIIEAQERLRVMREAYRKGEPPFNQLPASSPRRTGTSSSLPSPQIPSDSYPSAPKPLFQYLDEATSVTSALDVGLDPKPKPSRPIPGLISLNQQPLTFTFDLKNDSPNRKRKKTSSHDTADYPRIKTALASTSSTGPRNTKLPSSKKPKFFTSDPKSRKRMAGNFTINHCSTQKVPKDQTTPIKSAANASHSVDLSRSPNDTLSKEDFTKLLDLKPVQRPAPVVPIVDSPSASTSSAATLLAAKLNSPAVSIHPVMSSTAVDRVNKPFMIDRSQQSPTLPKSLAAAAAHSAPAFSPQVTITTVPKRLPSRPLRLVPPQDGESIRSVLFSDTPPPAPKPPAFAAGTSGNPNPFSFIKMSDYSRAALLFGSVKASPNVATIVPGTGGVGIRLPNGGPRSVNNGISPKTLIDAALGLSQIRVNLRPPPGPPPALKPLTSCLPKPTTTTTTTSPLLKTLSSPPICIPSATANTRKDQDGSDDDLLIIDDPSPVASPETGALDLSHPRSLPSTVTTPNTGRTVVRDLPGGVKSTASPLPGTKAPSPMKLPPPSSGYKSSRRLQPSKNVIKGVPKPLAPTWLAAAAQYGNLDLLQNWFSRFGLPVSAAGLKSLPLRPNANNPTDQNVTQSTGSSTGPNRKCSPCSPNKLDSKKSPVLKIPPASSRPNLAGTSEAP